MGVGMEKQEQRRISVVMCTYNGARYLRQQMDSILAQTYPLHEIIVQDDGSNDATWMLLEEYARRNPIIRIYHNTDRHGVNGNFFSAMRRATGTHIAISDQDDIWQPDKIERQVAAIGDKMLCTGHSRPFSDDGSFAHYDARRPNTHLLRMLFTSLPGHTFLFDRRLLTEVMPRESVMYEVSYYDAALSVAAAACDSIVYIDDVLVDFRRHASATTYTDYKGSLPSLGNAVRMFLLTWNNRSTLRPVMLKYLNARKDMLQALTVQTATNRKACALIDLENRTDLTSQLKMTVMMLRNSHLLFHTCGGGVAKKLRALLYPIMQMYPYRGVLENK